MSQNSQSQQTVCSLASDRCASDDSRAEISQNSTTDRPCVARDPTDMPRSCSHAAAKQKRIFIKFMPTKFSPTTQVPTNTYEKIKHAKS